MNEKQPSSFGRKVWHAVRPARGFFLAPAIVFGPVIVLLLIALLTLWLGQWLGWIADFPRD